MSQTSKFKSNSPSETIPIKKLIIVCCHAIWLGGPSHGEDESEWLIEPFQKGETPTYLAHIRAGINLLEKQQPPDALLVFSGGATKGDRTTLSEGQSYLSIARILCPLHDHMIAETHATDSYQNLLFSLVHYHAHLTHKIFGRVLITGTSSSSSFPDVPDSASAGLFSSANGSPFFHVPAEIAVISHEFKHNRFLHLHIPALRFPVERVRFVGMNPPEEVISTATLEKGEAEKGYGIWKEDLYGAGEFLSRKRVMRGWKEEMLSELEQMIDMECVQQRSVSSLLRWNGGSSGKHIFPGTLPWL